MTGLDAKLQRDRKQRNTGDQGALEDKEEIYFSNYETTSLGLMNM